MFLWFVFACAPPPEAPDNLAALCDYMYGHAWDEDPETLVVGVENLSEWLAQPGNLESTIEGYQINDLSDESVANIDEKERKIEDTIVGAAVAFAHENSISDVIQVNFVEDWAQVYEGTYEDYERVFTESPSCLIDQGCMEIEYDSASTSKWAGLITVSTENHGQIRWFETESLGNVLIMRNWLKNPVEVQPESLGIQVFAQYMVAIYYEDPNSDRMIRTSATWIDSDYGVAAEILDEDWAKNQVVKNMQRENETIQSYIEENILE